VIQTLSRATTYLTTYFIDQRTGEPTLRSHATGFFLRANTALLLVTSWHVVSGLDPVDPSLVVNSPPHFLKVSVVDNEGSLSEISLPLYGSSMQPMWEEHPDGSKVDIAIYPLPLTLEKYFQFVDIQSAEDSAQIAEAVGKDVFILGYPFSSYEMRRVFGEDAAYYLPIWKHGTIATEPALRLGHRRVLLIDSLSRPGMSGAPIVIAQDAHLLRAQSETNSKVMERILAGDHHAILELDQKALADEKVKQFQFLGVYSGVIGSTRLAEVALGRCWHMDTLHELVANARPGVMPFHAPLPNAHYEAFLAQFPPRGDLILKNADGDVAKHISMK